MKNLNETSRNEFKFYFENKNFKKILIISGKIHSDHLEQKN